MSTSVLSAELSLTLKNAEPAMKAARKVRQKMERGKTVFAMSLDCFGAKAPRNDNLLTGFRVGARNDRLFCVLLSLGLIMSLL